VDLKRKLYNGKRITLLGAFLFFVLVAVLCYFLPKGGSFEALAVIGAIVTGAILFWRVMTFTIHRSIWRLRNRLIVSELFIGVVPIVLVLLLVALATYIVAGQTAAYLVVTELDRTLDILRIPERVLRTNPTAPPAAVLDQLVPFIKQRFPNFRMRIRRGDTVFYYPVNTVLKVEGAAPAYTGLTIVEGQYCAWSHATSSDLDVDVVAPVEKEMLGELVPKLGQVDLRGNDDVKLAHRTLTADELRRGDVDAVPPPANQFDYEVFWPSTVPIAEFGTARKLNAGILYIVTRPSALMAAIFGERFQVAQALLWVFFAIAILFFIVEIVSLVVGISLTRTITSAIANLYEGTQRVANGDFSHRIRVKGDDQLAAVNKSFNSMTERVEQLLVVAKEKERLESELEIAREVQDQLFPNVLPRMQSLEITGLCRPARMVSGDYYDYLRLQQTTLALAIGDVAGKGISAALLMASIQSIMRTQLSEDHTTYSTCKLVSQLNRQLYLNTSPEKYATFLFGIYDENDRVLTYTNAGHLPPILIRRGEPTLLEVTGTVVGAFQASKYEEQKISLEAGDLLVCYTDGITEPENEYGEEFGTDRLVAAMVRHQKLDPPEMINRVMDAVRAWTSAPELPDDMTLVLMRRNA
jgi:sigma-B regulation protein RsbU (phosphoserine phosphatase)